MNTQTDVTQVDANIWKKIGHWLRSVADAVDYDPMEAMHTKITELEIRLECLETETRNDVGPET